MAEAQPVLHKREGDSHPWRVVVRHEDGTMVGIPYCAFRRKREAVAVLQRLQALQGVSWGTDTDRWPTVHLEAVRMILAETSGYRSAGGMRVS